VELIGRARRAGVAILAVDTPTAVDLTSGDLSDPVVQAHVTVTFHRPKTGLWPGAGFSAVRRPAGSWWPRSVFRQEADRG
jgi:NAD(P)H-hydrate repair Nnr-like enzyme with NAD(P)H-hydrate epimerase domain